MARNEPNNAGYRPLRDHPFLMGIALGVLLGLGMALIVAIIVGPSSAPLPKETAVAKPKVPEPSANANLPTQPPPLPTTKPAEVAKSEPPQSEPPKADDKSRFDYAKILPENEERIREKDIKAAKTANASKETYYLQAGAFQNSEDADNLRAKLALDGIEAQIQTAQLPDNKVWHRVRLGPFKSVDEVGRAKAQLKKNQIEGTLIKVKDAVAQR